MRSRLWACVITPAVFVATACGRLGYAAEDGELTDASFLFDAPGLDAPFPDAPLLDASALDAPLADAPNLDAPDLDAGLEPDDACGAPGYVDLDGDGSGAGTLLTCPGAGVDVVPSDGDCDDTDPLRAPVADEGCNGVDDDCDLAIDDGACGGVVARTEPTPLEFVGGLTDIDIGATDELIVLGARGGVAEVEVHAPTDLSRLRGASTPAPAGSQTWVRGTPDGGWVLGWGRGLARHDADGTLRWSVPFTGTGSFAPYGHAVNATRIAIGGDLGGPIDLGDGVHDPTPSFASLVAVFDTASGGLVWTQMDPRVQTIATVLLPGDEVGIGGFFATGSASFGDASSRLRPLSIVRLSESPRYRGEWRSTRSPSADEAILGMARVGANDVVFAADFEGGDFEGLASSERGGVVARVDPISGAVRWARAISLAHTNDYVRAAAGGDLACFGFSLDIGPVDFGASVVAPSAGLWSTCFDLATGVTRFGFAGAVGLAVGRTGIVYTTQRESTGLLSIVARR